MQAKGNWGLATKKEQLKLEKEMMKLKRSLDGIKNMDGLPAVVFVIDPRKERIAVHEANRLGIPVVAVTDTNCDPDPIDFVIPSNDDAIRAIKLFTAAVADASLEGRQLFEDNMRQKKARDEELARKPIREKLEEVSKEAPSPAGVDIEIKRSRKKEDEENVSAEGTEPVDEKPAKTTGEASPAETAADEPAMKNEPEETSENEKNGESKTQ